MTISKRSFQHETSPKQFQITKNADQSSRSTREAGPNTRFHDTARPVSDPPDNPVYIQRCVERISQQGLIDAVLVEQYLRDQHRRYCRPNTVERTGLDILLFLKYLKQTGRPSLASITRADVSAFVEHEQDRGLQPATVSTRLRTLYAFLGYLAERDIVSPDVLRKKMRIKVPDPLPRAIDAEDIQALLAVIETPRDRAMILTLLRTGMRIGELLNTRVEDVHLEEKRIEIYEARKTGVGRVVYLSNDANLALSTWFAERDPQVPYLFYSPGRKNMGYTGARNIFCRYLVKSGLAHKGYGLHCLRHTFASELLNAGMRLECLQQLLGHSCIEMTRRYARLTDITRQEEYFKAMEKIERGEIHGSYRFDA